MFFYTIWLIILIFVLYLWRQNSIVMIIGRKEEQKILLSAAQSEYSELIAVYGRRRVGKTYLIRETFGYKFTFQHTGLAKGKTKDQLFSFAISLRDAGYDDCPIPQSWLEAFGLLSHFLKNSTDEKKIIFLDELPWMDTPRSNFISAFEHFWNGWASARKDIVLIICGSATSWIINKVINDHGGLHNRVTQRIALQPFTLRECEMFVQNRGLEMSRCDREHTLICYESPFRVGATLQAAFEVLGDREAAVCMELTKLHERVSRGYQHSWRQTLLPCCWQ